MIEGFQVVDGTRGECRGGGVIGEGEEAVLDGAEEGAPEGGVFVCEGVVHDTETGDTVEGEADQDCHCGEVALNEVVCAV